MSWVPKLSSGLICSRNSAACGIAKHFPPIINYIVVNDGPDIDQGEGGLRKVGLVINPIAGYGGPLAWKGTDGRLVPSEAAFWATRRAEEALFVLGQGWSVMFLTAAGPMGEDTLRKLDLSAVITYSPQDTTTALDTKAACASFLSSGVELIVFCGGDGTARDVFDAVGSQVPVIGIPAGVKMHSGVFAATPTAAGLLLEDWLLGDVVMVESTVVDVDEVEFRLGRVVHNNYGTLRTPSKAGRLQPPKGQVEAADDEEDKWEIGLQLKEMIPNGVAAILGPGSTIQVAARAMGVEKTPLGVDVYLDGVIVAADVDEGMLLELLESTKEAWVVVTPIGRQGFIFGRGNQQVSPAVLAAVADANIIIAATPQKLAMTPLLMVDTGDAGMDERLRGHRKVLTGQGRWKVAFVV
jgi:predicted polyphosphate/ATP-dependent NAD kinase